MDLELTDFRSLLIWVIEGGGAGIISWWLYGRLPNTKARRKMGKEWRRFFAILLALVIGGGVAYLGSFFDFYPAPENLEAWLDLLLKIGLMAATSQQLIHGFTKYRKERR